MPKSAGEPHKERRPEILRPPSPSEIRSTDQVRRPWSLPGTVPISVNQAPRPVPRSHLATQASPSCAISRRMLAAIMRSVSDPHRGPIFLERLLPEVERTMILFAFDTNVPVNFRPWCSIVTALPCSCSFDRGGALIALLCFYVTALPRPFLVLAQQQ